MKLDDVLKRYTHFIWDWNGTLLDDVDLVVALLAETMIHYGFEPVSRQQYRSKFGFPVIRFYEKLGFDFSRISFDELSADFGIRYMQRVGGCSLYRGSRRLLAEIRGAGKSNYLLSASHERDLKHQVRHFKVDHLFDQVYGLQDRLAQGKVERGRNLVARLTERRGAARESIVMLGDTDHDLEVGRRLGIEVVLFADGHQTRERLQQIHDRVIPCRT